ncbi:MAG: c-type cytochrome [Pirellulaceae bacterium]|nr:c-type cytochrome [Pirellulaceae bacterium]
MRIVFAIVLVFTCCCVDAAAQSNHDAAQPLPPTEAAATMSVPDGFRVTLFAGEPDVMQPIGFCLDDRGRLWVAEAYNYPKHGDKSGDRIVILEDTDGDGRHDKRTVFYDQLNYVSGIEIGFGGVWVMTPPYMYFIPDADGDDRPDAKPTVLLDGFGNHANAHNMANAFAWGPDGWLYATHGRTNWSMIGKPGTPDNQRVRFDGGVWRYHPTRHVWEPYADGTTNPWGIDWNDYGHAFICNCVNPHLFQVIQGAHYEPWRGRKSSQFAYQRIDTIADHLHFVGLGNVRNGIGSDAEDTAGGGHAHCGTMIYLGDSFPDSYRNQLFTNNIHGRRINNDLLRRQGSGYTAAHGPDLMKSNDPWFMGVTLTYGPNGEVYVIDWSDTGECHSTRNTQRQTGRVFRISYLKTQLDRVDLTSKTNDELVALQLHKNDWLVRHARRLLQERAVASDLTAVGDSLHAMFDTQTHIPTKLRALWALHSIGQADVTFLRALLSHADENIRSWAITLLGEGRKISDHTANQLADLAADDPSPLVRLSLASLLQRLPLADRWLIAESLASHGEDASDQNLPLMIWYGVEPLIDENLERYVSLGTDSAISRVRINVARRITESDQCDDGLELYSRWVSDFNEPTVTSDVLNGILLGLEGRRRIAMPPSWRKAFDRLRASDDPQVTEQAMRLALRMGDDRAVEVLTATAIDSKQSDRVRNQAIVALVDSKQPGIESMLLTMLDDDATREQSLASLAAFNQPGTADAILSRYGQFSEAEKRAAVATLASRNQWAARLISAVQSNQIPVTDITAFTARQIRSLADAELTDHLNELWGDVRETRRDRAREIDKMKRWLTADVIAGADLSRGEALFKKQCSNCHRFFGEGGEIGPDITGAQRNNVDYMLENMVDPSASVSKDYRMHIVQTVDGRLITGLIESQDNRAITLLTTNERIVIPRGEIESQKLSDVSIMPNGLLDTMTEQDIRDLMGYLQK